MKRVNFHESRIFRSKPGIGFDLFFPMRFDISMPIILQQKLKEKYRLKQDVRYYQISEKFRKKLLEFFDVKDERELINKNVNLKSKFRELKKELKDEMGVIDREFSKLMQEWANKMIEEDKNEK